MKATRAAALLALVSCGGSDDAPAPRLVLVSIDTLRADHLGCYGYERATSPHIDALAERSALFESVQSTASTTAPSHMTMFTGVLPAVHGVRNQADLDLSPGIPTLAERLRDEGFATAAFAGGGLVSEQLGFARGFDVFDSRLEPFERKLERVDAWLEALDDDRPAFLFVHTYGVHAPYIPSTEHDLFTRPGYSGPLRERVEALRYGLRRDLDPDLAALCEAFWNGSSSFDDDDVRHLVDLYDGCIHEVDDGVGRLLASLGRHGWLDAGAFVLTSDHGEAFREHGSFSHRQLHREELDVPLIVRPAGGLAQGLRVAGPVSLLDLAPTLLDLLGLPAADAMQGRSLLPLDAPRGERPRLASGGEELRLDAVLLDGKKLVTRSRVPRQAFDLRADPWERDNLVDDDAARDWSGRLAALLEGMHDDAARLRAILGGPGEAGALSDDQLRQLEALGYLQR